MQDTPDTAVPSLTAVEQTTKHFCHEPCVIWAVNTEIRPLLCTGKLSRNCPRLGLRLSSLPALATEPAATPVSEPQPFFRDLSVAVPSCDQTLNTDRDKPDPGVVRARGHLHDYMNSLSSK